MDQEFYHVRNGFFLPTLWWWCYQIDNVIEDVPANFRHSSFDFPSTSATAKDAVKVSPAPVVSSTSAADMMDCLIGFSPWVKKADPLSPSFTRTCLTPWNWAFSKVKRDGKNTRDLIMIFDEQQPSQQILDFTSYQRFVKTRITNSNF